MRLRELLSFQRPAIVVVRPDQMTDAQLTAALRSIPDEHQFYKAIIQLLEQTREEAIEDEANDSWSPTAMAKHSGGAQYLRAVRNDLILRRQGKTPNGQRRTPNVQ